MPRMFDPDYPPPFFPQLAWFTLKIANMLPSVARILSPCRLENARWELQWREEAGTGGDLVRIASGYEIVGTIVPLTTRHTWCCELDVVYDALSGVSGPQSITIRFGRWIDCFAGHLQTPILDVRGHGETVIDTPTTHGLWFPSVADPCAHWGVVTIRRKGFPYLEPKPGWMGDREPKPRPSPDLDLA